MEVATGGIYKRRIDPEQIVTGGGRSALEEDGIRGIRVADVVLHVISGAAAQMNAAVAVAVNGIVEYFVPGAGSNFYRSAVAVDQVVIDKVIIRSSRLRLA